ncbi:alpha/beta fold hydrolase [Saccharothrix violaceirubra]|nr:alpha/beta fold hydrolase [Saccharothrix violaceirubra]
MSWLRTFTPRPNARFRLFCLPHAGGVAGGYRPWVDLLPADVELVAIQYPGRQDRFGEPCARSVADLAAGAGTAVADLLSVPYAVFGHSMGATVAFEMIRSFQKAGARLPVRMFASARTAPSRSRSTGVDPSDEEELLAHIRRLGSAGGASLDAEPRLRPVVLPSLRADLEAVNTYRFAGGEPLRCPVTAIAGTTDASVERADVKAWRLHTTQAFEYHELPGGHFYLEESTAELVSLVVSTITDAVPA